MKVNLKNNNWIRLATIALIVLSLPLFFLKIGQVEMPHAIYYAYSILIEALYVLLISYLINVLIFFREKISISTALTMYICVDVIKFAATEWPGKLLSYSLTPSLGILTFVVYIYLFVQIFKINSGYIALPFKLFGFSFLVVLLIYLIIIIIFPSASGSYNLIYIIFSLLTPISILYILKRVNKFLKENSPKPVDADV